MNLCNKKVRTLKHKRQSLGSSSWTFVQWLVHWRVKLNSHSLAWWRVIEMLNFNDPRVVCTETCDYHMEIGVNAFGRLLWLSGCYTMQIWPITKPGLPLVNFKGQPECEIMAWIKYMWFHVIVEPFPGTASVVVRFLMLEHLPRMLSTTCHKVVKMATHRGLIKSMF